MTASFLNGSGPFPILCFLLVFTTDLHAETRVLTADVTGDNMYDAIKITDNAVFVVDKMLCCTKQRFPVISGCDSIVDVVVDDFSSINRSNEIAVVLGASEAIWTVVYAFKDGAFSRISNDLPGRIALYNNVPCMDSGIVAGNDTITLPWPLIDSEGRMKPAPLSSTVDTPITVESGAVIDDTLPMTADCMVVVAVRKQGSGVSMSLYDRKGRAVARGTPDDPLLVGLINSSNAGWTILHVDNDASTEPVRLRIFIYTFTMNE